MAVLYRTSQSAEFVHRSDADADQSGKSSADGEWLLAAGQPSTCSRWRVRALSTDEWTQATQHEDPAARNVALVTMGLLAVDDLPQPKDLAAWWHTEVANLVAAVTLAPFAGRLARFRTSPAEPSADTPAG